MIGLTLAASANADRATNALSIPEVPITAKRTITVDDLAAVRTIDSLSVSPDGQRYAILVRQAEPSANEYRSAWFSGSTAAGELVRLGDGGEVRPRVMWTGHVPGEIGASESRWSPDGQWLAYTVRRNDEVQLWRSRIDGSVQEQLTNNAADVREFVWSDDGKALYFTVGTPRSELRAQEQARAWQGYRFDEDFWSFTDLLGPQLIRALETKLSVWVVTPGDRQERLGDETEQAAFARARARDEPAVDVTKASAPDIPVPPVAQAGNRVTWRVTANPRSQVSRVIASLSADGRDAIRCPAEECSGAIKKVWWSENGRKVLFWRGEGVNDAEHGFYSWDPATTRISTVVRLRDDALRLCGQAGGDRLICVRETASQPAHVAAIDMRSGRTQLLADINPEFRNFRLGKVERFEWDTPKLAWNEPGGELAGLYPKRAYGYILYPPDFDPIKKYPVFIDPYLASGFNPVGAEHALHAYAANGFVVLRTTFPQYIDRLGRGIGMQQLYSRELDYPHLTMLMESTLRGLDTVAKRGFVDERRVGIGGVSHGTFVPLYMMQKYDRIAAISISSPHWGPLQHYGSTQKARGGLRDYWEWAKANPERWAGIDTAEHVESMEAPILMHLAAQESYALIRLIRHLADAGKPYDAYVFAEESHIKWQAAHLHAIASRNLDWFRFWLQGFEDPGPAKAEQYLRWRKLREQQRAHARDDQAAASN
jgi:dipeptidyl aminopeptidase/acylaminoacyl peptidase